MTARVPIDAPPSPAPGERLMINVTLYNDPACPWAYSERPALRVLEWRYGDQLDWRLVLIGLTESASQYEARGYTPLRGALGQLNFRRYGMPFSPSPKPRLSATARACRAVVATRIIAPGSEWHAFRALQLANFTSPILLDDDNDLEGILRRVPGVDANKVVSMLDSPEVTEAYERDRAETRSAAGTAAELQRKTATTDGPVRFTAPSVVFEAGGAAPRRGRLPAGRGLRRPDREPRPDARAQARARDPGAADRALRGGPDDAGGRRVDGAGQRPPRQGHRRARATRARGRR